MNTILAIILPMIFPLVAVIIWRAPQAKDKDEWLCGSAVVTDLNIILGSFCIYFIWRMYPIYGVVHAGLVYYYSLFILPITIKGINNLGTMGIVWRGLQTAFLIIVSTLVALIICVRPYFSQPPDISQDMALNHLTHIQSSMSDIRTAIGNSQNALNEASQTISKSLEDLNLVVEKKSDEVRNLETKYTTLQKEISQLRNLATLTQPQTDAVVHALSRNKWIDYIIGFLIGIASSAAFAVISQLMTAMGIRKLGKK